MSDVRLKVNVVADGKFYERNTVIDDAILPDHLKTEAHVSYDLEDAAGCVLLLHDLNFSTVAKPDSSGIPTSFPRQVMAGDLLDLKTVPPAYRESLKEGEDFKTKWTNEDRKELQADYLKQFETEPAPTYRSR